MIITLVGGGSTFTPGIVKSIALRREELDVNEVRLFDIDKERQATVAVVVAWILHPELTWARRPAAAAAWPTACAPSSP